MSLTAEQKTLRKNGIGASEIASACGLCPYRSPLVLYRQKRGELPEPEETWSMVLGNLLEPAILEMWSHTTKGSYERPGTLIHPREPWILATPDGLGTLDGRKVVIEAKRSAYKRPDWGHEGSDQVPVTYACQCLWLMLVLRALGHAVEEAQVAAFFRGDSFQIFKVPWDEGRAAWLVSQGRKFWFDHVLKGNAPEERQAA